MVVYAGKPQVLKWQMAEFFNCLVDADAAVFYLL
jgi:hypothetical protein